MINAKLQWLAWLSVLFASVLIVTAMVLGVGIVKRQITFNGPFKAESDSVRNLALTVDLRPALPLRKVFSSGGESTYNPNASELEVYVNGVPLIQPHSLHDVVRLKGDGAFSHWGDNLIFSLPHGVANSGATRIEVQFPLRLHPRLLGIAIILGVWGTFILLRQLRQQDAEAYNTRIPNALMILGYALQGLMIFCLLIAIVFLGTVFLGWAAGFTLPNTALFHWWPQFNGLALREPSFGHVILTMAMIGVGAAWLASTLGQRGRAFANIEARLAAGFRRYGVLFIIGLFLYSVGATWAGIPRPEDLGGNAIAGLLPFNDANGHFQHVYFQAINGDWTPFIGRRPLAAAFRTMVVVGVDYNNYHFLILQTVALALAIFYATRAVMAWRGLWAGLTFLGLGFILVRPYLPTNLTEPLGIFWALVSVPFLVRAIRFNRLDDAATGLHLTLWALLTRMGAMFTLPALGLWIILSRWGTRREILRATLLVVALALVNMAMVGGMSEFYGTTGGAVGSNFSHTFCGLAHGTTWSGCGTIYVEEMKKITSEAEQAKFYYAKAAEKITNAPRILFGRLLEGERYFSRNIGKRILSGYTGSIPDSFPAILWWLFAIAGLVWVMRHRREDHEGKFWLLFVAGLVASAPFVIFDDGWRVMCASFVILALLPASGFSSPLHQPESLPSSQVYGAIKGHWLALTLVAVLCVSVPALVHQRDWLEVRRIPTQNLAKDEEIFLGTRRMSGFLVVSDEQALPKQVPAIHESDFVRIIRNSGIEQYEALVTPEPIHQAPFAIASAIPVNQRTHGLLIMPAEVFTALDDKLWRFRLGEGKYWIKVTEATPVSE